MTCPSLPVVRKGLEWANPYRLVEEQQRGPVESAWEVPLKDLCFLVV